MIPDECRVHVNYRFAPDKSLAEAKALMIGADAGAKLGNGEHQPLVACSKASASR